MAKAFDVINHEILLDKLENLGVRGISNDWFRSFLANRSQKVMVKDKLSMNTKSIKLSVLQGSILGVLLFLIYINDLSRSCNLFSVLFADDSTLLHAEDDILKLQQNVNSELQKLAIWFKANKLALNIKKSKVMLFSPDGKCQKVNIFLNNNDLGFTDLTNITQIEQISSNSSEPSIRILAVSS